MLGNERFTGTADAFLQKYPAHDRIGRMARQHDAKKMTEAMREIENEVKQREKMNSECKDRIDRMTAEHHLNMDYLFTFGIRCEHREELLRILNEVEQHGGLSLQEAAALANARARQEEMMQPNPVHNANGLSGPDLV